MKKPIIAGLLAACVIAGSLTGCQAVGRALTSLTDGAEEQLANQIARGAASQMPSIEDLLQSTDRTDDHRESFTYTPGDETVLVLDVRDTSQVIVQEAERADIQFEYDSKHFQVTAAPDDSFLVLDIREQNRSRITDREKGNYKCIITLPGGLYERLQLVGEHGGAAFLEPSVPVIADGKGMGLMISRPKANVSITGDSSAFFAEIGTDYTGSFTFQGKAGAFCLDFPDGEPDPLDFHLETSSGAVVALPEGWGSPLESADYSTGTGGAVFSISLSAGAGAVTVG